MRLAVKRGEFVALEEVRECWARQVARAKDFLRHKFEMESLANLPGGFKSENCCNTRN